MRRLCSSAWSNPYDPEARHVWATSRNGHRAGDEVPADLACRHSVMVNLYYARRIVPRAAFSYPAPSPAPLPAGQPVKHGRKWTVPGTRRTFRTKKAALQWLGEQSTRQVA